MTFTIHSIGDSAFLEQILIAVSMITGSGSFRKMVSIGLLLGVFVISAQSVFQGAKQINFQQVLVSWILYACFFYPTTTVSIEDAYTGEVRVVANVPIGVGFAGGVISNVGYTITNLFEQGYGVIAPSITENHFLESLKILNTVRKKTYSSAVFSALNTVNGGGYVDLRHSWNNYIRECTLTKIDLNKMSLDKLMNSQIDTAYEFKSQLYGTKLYLSPTDVNGTNYTCSDAWSALDTATQNLNSPIITEVLNSILDLQTTEITGENAISKISDSLQALGATSTSSFNYVKTALLEPVYYEAAMGRYQDFQDFGSALMVNQAIQQRNMQWSAEQSMFMSVVRPMLTFFEGFIYAITPIMAFMMVIGSFGLTLAGKYIQTVLWIQFWLPVLSIINLFVYMAASSDLSSVATQGLDSMYALSTASDKLQNWIATGGMLAAATPMISLFIVTGSTYAFTNIASRINGSDSINEKMQTPDVIAQGPVMNSMPAYNHNQFSGGLVNGAENTISSLSLGSTLSSGIASAQSVQNQTSQAFQKTLGHGFSNNVSKEQSYTRLSSIGRNLSAQHSEQSELINQQQKKFSDKFQVDDKHSDAIKGALSLATSGTLSASGVSNLLKPLVGTKRNKNNSASNLSVNGKIQGQSNSTSDDSSTWSTSDVSNYIKNLSYANTDSQAMTNQLAQSFSQSNNESFKKTWGDTFSHNLSQSANDVLSASKTFTNMSQLQDKIGAMTNTDFKTLGGMIARSPEATDMLNSYFRYSAPKSVKQEAATLYQRYRRYGMDPDIANSASYLTAMTNSSNYQPGKQLNGFKAALQAINAASGHHYSTNNDAYKYENIKTPTNTNISQDISNNLSSETLHNPEFTNGNLRKEVEKNIQEFPTDTTIIQQEHDKNQQKLESDSIASNQNISRPEIIKARNNLLHSLPEMSWSTSGWGAYKNTSNWTKRRAEQALGSLVTGSKTTNDSFATSMEQLRTMTPVQKKAFIDNHKNNGSFTKMGYKILGVATTAYDATKKWLTGKSDLSAAAQNMSIEEKGAFYATAFSTAVNAGTKASEKFMKEYGTQFKGTMQSIAQNRYGLTQAQAAIYAESFDTNQETMDQAIQHLKTQYASKNPNGSIMMKDGHPVLSKDNEVFTNKLVNILQNSTDAADRSGSYLSAIRGYNIVNKNLNNISKNIYHDK